MEKDLKEIGFYSLSDDRVNNLSNTSQMKRCEMIITEYCNFSCPYCRGLDDSIYGDRKLKQLSLSEIKQNIDYWCENEPLENIRFSGGEPSLHKDIIEIIAYAKSKGIKRIAVSTNGSNKIELYKKMLDAGVNDFSISLDANCAEFILFSDKKHEIDETLFCTGVAVIKKETSVINAINIADKKMIIEKRRKNSNGYNFEMI